MNPDLVLGNLRNLRTLSCICDSERSNYGRKFREAKLLVLKVERRSHGQALQAGLRSYNSWGNSVSLGRAIEKRLELFLPLDSSSVRPMLDLWINWLSKDYAVLSHCTSGNLLP